MSNVTYTSSTGKQITVALDGQQVVVSIAGVIEAAKASLWGANYIKAVAPTLAREFNWALQIQLGSKTATIGLPAKHIDAVRAMFDAADAAQPVTRQTLESAYYAAKRRADEAREAAYRNDTGAGWDTARKLDDAAEQARLALVAFGGEHPESMDDQRDE